MHVKSETKKFLQSFFFMVKTQFHNKIQNISYSSGDLFFPQIQKIRSDNGTEFLSINMQQFFQSHGIIHQRSCVATPK